MHEPQYFSVTSLNRYVESLLANQLTLHNITLKGEVSNLKKYSNGHYYFTLKDQNSRISAVMFRAANQRLKFELSDGQEILAYGSVGLYSGSGTYQIIVEKAEQYGLGQKLIDLEKLKKQLASEGLFDPSRKRPLPQFPENIGVITGANSAAEKDILENISRRNPLVKIYVFNSLVQGDKAPQELIEALNLSATYPLDVLIIARGGGGIEDLWAFNDEELVRAIAKYPYPVIAAIGHETDTTLTDYVSDLRVSTPTAAAEQAVLDVKELKQDLIQFEERMTHATQLRFNKYRDQLANYSSRPELKNPLLTYQKHQERLKTSKSHLNRFIVHKLENSNLKLNNLARTFSSLVNNNLEKKSQDLNRFKLGLEALSPKSVLNRGYAYLTNTAGHIVSSIQDVEVGEIVQTTLHDGKIRVRVEGKEESHE